MRIYSSKQDGIRFMVNGLLWTRRIYRYQPISREWQNDRAKKKFRCCPDLYASSVSRRRAWVVDHHSTGVWQKAGVSTSSCQTGTICQLIIMLEANVIGQVRVLDMTSGSWMTGSRHTCRPTRPLPSRGSRRLWYCSKWLQSPP